MLVKSWHHYFYQKICPAYVGFILNDILHCFYMFLLFVTHLGIICMLCSLFLTLKLCVGCILACMCCFFFISVVFYCDVTYAV